MKNEKNIAEATLHTTRELVLMVKRDSSVLPEDMISLPYTEDEEVKLTLLKEFIDTQKGVVPSVSFPNYLFASFTIFQTVECRYKGKKTMISADEMRDNVIYILDSIPGNERRCTMMPASQLSSVIKLSDFDSRAQKKILRNPEKLCVVYDNATGIIIADKVDTVFVHTSTLV
jgi:hypothetical protein